MLVKNRLIDDGDQILMLEASDGLYVFHYNEQTHCDCLQKLGQYASHPDLAFTWHDAAVVSAMIREIADRRRKAEREFNGK